MEVAGCRMHDEPGGLVDDDEVVVFVEDVEIDRLGGIGDDRHFHGMQGDAVAGRDLLLDGHLAAVDGDLAGPDPLLQPAARVIAEQFRQRLIEAPAGQFIRNRGLKHLLCHHCTNPVRIRYNFAFRQ